MNKFDELFINGGGERFSNRCPIHRQRLLQNRIPGTPFRSFPFFSFEENGDGRDGVPFCRVWKWRRAVSCLLNIT